MATRAPRATPTPTTAPQQTIDEAGANLPAKRSKLATAMDSVTHHMTEIERLGATIAEVEEQYPKTFVFAVATKDGYKLADKVRKDSRASRLHVATMRKEGTDLLNTLKTELWAVADPQIARLQAIEDNARDQIAAQDKKETDRKAAHEERIAAIVRFSQGVATMDSEAIAQRIRDIQALKIDDSYEEYQKPAALKRVSVLEVLELGHIDAVKREEEAERKRKADEAEKARQALADAARNRIAYYKGLADGATDTGAENIRALVANITPPGSENDETKYGDLAEFVDMARGKAHDDLRALLKAAEAEESIVVAEEIAAGHAGDDPLESPTIPAADIRSAGTSEEFQADPFAALPSHGPDALVSGTSAATSATEALRPVTRGRATRWTAAATPSPAPEPVAADPRQDVDMTKQREEAPDLVTAARNARREWIDLSGDLTVTLPPSFIVAMRQLREAIDLHDEFAD